MADVGRPTVMTDEVLRKLEEAFALGCTDLEACLYADIAKSTFYDYQIANPEFVERKEKLKETPMLKARGTVVRSLNQTQPAQWYLERKRKNEFAQRNEFTGPEGTPIPILATMNAIPTHNGDNQDSEAQSPDTSDTGRDSGEQDNLDIAPVDERSSERQEAHPHLSS
jgi:hypothetical protein